MGCSPYTKRSVQNNLLGNLASLKRSSCYTGDSTTSGDFSQLCDQTCSSSSGMKPKTHFAKMIRDFGFSCFVPSCMNEDLLEEESEASQSQKHYADNDLNLEHNKAWLLAESGGCAGDLTNGEPNSVHSSFRFSLCSQVELDSLNINCSSSTTILMVNLDNNLPNSRLKELKCQRFESLERSISPVANSLIRFSYGEILAASRKFSQGRVLGRGALSYVFRGRIGVLRSAVAIKRLDKEDKESSKAFCRELMIASSLGHPNVVPLVGFCIDPEEGLFLVYKYVSSGSLEHHLHGKKRGAKGFASLSWSVRYKVAIGIAEAIAYMHNGTERCIVHRDIKPSNILLSSKKRPKLCDFGLATWTPAPSIPFLCKTVKGTFGYLAPEYFQHGKVSDKIDVYAFGVVLLELLTGRKPIEASRPPGEENLVEWAKPLMDQGGNNNTSHLDKILDPRAKFTPKSSVQISRMARAASACLRCEESSRPGMIDIISFLRGEEPFCYVSNSSGKIGSSRYLSSNRYFQHQQMKNEMITNHLALAMLGVSELDDDDYFYGR